VLLIAIESNWAMELNGRGFGGVIVDEVAQLYEILVATLSGSLALFVPPGRRKRGGFMESSKAMTVVV